MKENLMKNLKKLSKTGSFKILIALNDGSKRWSQLEKVTYKKSPYQSINGLFDIDLIEVTVAQDVSTGLKAYQFAHPGKKVVQYLEQIEKEFEEYHSKAPPKDPEEFIGELMEED
ncbi:hypothetical protein [Geoglobus acetivorans]|uniref:HTH hxlR-type domain-containing protein n=1 Tax=Geoglobus acetivorans TaxID=565033 RepID=A0A0A7GE53_GEOAI|nr:hypothetical protein GACE_1279 [Geoglobus acetivorans]